MKMEDLVIASVDDHVVEPPEAFFPHYSSEFKSEAPRITDRDGKDVWLWNDTIYPTIGLNAVVGRPRSEFGMEPFRYDQMRTGCYDPVARVADMNVNGVLSSLCFATFPMSAGTVFIGAGLKGHKEQALRGVRAYNDWHVHEWCTSAPGRFIPMILLPLWDMDATVAEIKRWVPHNVHAVSIPDNPSCVGLPSIHNEYWEPLWKACSDHKIVLNCHIGTGAPAPHASDESPIDAWITTMPMSIANSAADWLFAAFLRRYPNLRIALSEGGVGWVPYFLERADFTYEHHREWTFSDFGSERPSDVFKRHFITCFIEDKVAMENLKFINPDMVCAEIDYPHSDAVWPNSPEYLWNSVKNLDPAIIDKITHQNVFREFSFDPFPILGGREKCNVAHLRSLATDVDTSPRSGLGGLKTGSMGAEERKPVTSGEIQKMFASA